MDVEKYYPNILSDKSAKIIRKMWEDSELSMEGIDFDNLCRYLGSHLKKEEILEEGFEELLYTRKVKERKKKWTKKIGKKYTKKNCKKKQDNTADIETLVKDNSNEIDQNKKKKRTTEWMKPIN
jgi:hypothetical protein